MRGNINKVDIKVTCYADVFVLFKRKFCDYRSEVILIETVSVHCRVPIEDSNNVIGSFGIDDLNKS